MEVGSFSMTSFEKVAGGARKELTGDWSGREMSTSESVSHSRRRTPARRRALEVGWMSE